MFCLISDGDLFVIYQAVTYFTNPSFPATDSSPLACLLRIAPPSSVCYVQFDYEVSFHSFRSFCSFRSFRPFFRSFPSFRSFHSPSSVCYVQFDYEVSFRHLSSRSTIGVIKVNILDGRGGGRRWICLLYLMVL